MSRAHRTEMTRPARRPLAREEAVRARWPRVRVDYVEILPCPGGQRARVVVDVGGLATGDVHVALLPARRADIEAAGGVAQRRLDGRRRYPSGCVLFDTVVPDGEPPIRGEWLVRVRAAAGPLVPPVLYRLRVGAPAARGG